MENTALEPQTGHEIAVTASEVYEYVKEKLSPIVSEERAKVKEVLDKAKAITEIKTAEDYTNAVNTRKELKKTIKNGTARLEEIKNKAHKVHSAMTSSQKEIKFDKESDAEDKRIARLASDYDQEQERIRRKEQRKAEAKAKAEAEERALKEAAELEALGDKEAAAEVVEEAAHAPAPVVEVAKSTPQVEGSHYRDNWKPKNVDATKLPRKYMMPDMVKINAEVKANKGDTNIEGVEVWNDRVLVDRG